MTSLRQIIIHAFPISISFPPSNASRVFSQRRKKKKRKRKNSKNGNHVWRSFPKMADWPALFAGRKRPTDGSTHGREISLAPVVSRYPAVRFVHGI